MLIRPGVHEFLTKMARFYELVIFTASLSKYAEPLVEILDVNKYCAYNLYRQHCTFINGVFVKDLEKVGRDMKHTLIVDNSPTAYLFHPENAIPILSWYEDLADKELLKLIPFLEKMAFVEDVRKVVKQVVKDNVINFNKAAQVLKAERSTSQQHFSTKAQGLIQNTRAQANVQLPMSNILQDPMARTADNR